MFHPINTFNNEAVDIGVKKLRVLDQNQPCGMEDLSSTMGEVRF